MKGGRGRGVRRKHLTAMRFCKVLFRAAEAEEAKRAAETPDTQS